jgi:hypothetical protein
LSGGRTVDLPPDVLEASRKDKENHQHRQEARMPSSRWLKLVCKLICPPLAAAAILVCLSAPGAASIDQAGTLPQLAAVKKSCSGAFRYAARVGNDDIVEVSPVQAFARDRRLSRMRYAGRGLSDAEAVVSRLIVLTAMCGAR